MTSLELTKIDIELFRRTIEHASLLVELNSRSKSLDLTKIFNSQWMIREFLDWLSSNTPHNLTITSSKLETTLKFKKCLHKLLPQD